jgi:hypothetical protein
MDEGHPDVRGGDDAADDGPLVPARPLDGQGLAPRGRLHQDGRRPAHFEGQTEVEPGPGIEPIGRVGADLGNEVVEVHALGDIRFPLDAQEEGVGALLGGGHDEAGPARGVERPDERIFPGIEDLGGEAAREEREQDDEEDRFPGHPAIPACGLLSEHSMRKRG